MIAWQPPGVAVPECLRKMRQRSECVAEPLQTHSDVFYRQNTTDDDRNRDVQQARALISVRQGHRACDV